MTHFASARQKNPLFAAATVRGDDAKSSLAETYINASDHRVFNATSPLVMSKDNRIGPGRPKRR